MSLICRSGCSPSMSCQDFVTPRSLCVQHSTYLAVFVFLCISLFVFLFVFVAALHQCLAKTLSQLVPFVLKPNYLLAVFVFNFPTIVFLGFVAFLYCVCIFSSSGFFLRWSDHRGLSLTNSMLGRFFSSALLTPLPYELFDPIYVRCGFLSNASKIFLTDSCS